MLLEHAQAALREQETSCSLEKKKEQLLNENKQTIDRELAALEQERSLLSMSKEEYGVVMKEIVEQKEAAESEIEAKASEVKAAAERLEQFQEEEEAKRGRVFALQEAMQNEQSALNTLTRERSDKQIAVARLETRQEDLANECYQELRATIESIRERRSVAAPLSELDAVQVKIQKLKYQLTLIGGIDGEVMEEYQATKTRHDDLSGQLEDLGKALNDLEKLVVELDEIMRSRRAAGFKEIQREFRRYFTLLFEGGKADLAEVYGEEEIEEMRNGEMTKLRNNGSIEGNGQGEADEKNRKPGKKILTGIEVTACPPGKKISQVQALSGGERTLTAIALVCAILHINPPPFVVLDEVEAALDEPNTLRFTRILKELAKQSQFIIITHNRATMHAADALYGVTMGGDGMSRLLSVKLAEAAAT